MIVLYYSCDSDCLLYEVVVTLECDVHNLVSAVVCCITLRKRDGLLYIIGVTRWGVV